MAESYDTHRKEREGITECRITVNGEPLSEFVAKEMGIEITEMRIQILGKLSKQVSKANAPKTKRPGIGSGRGSGNPGVKKARVFSKEEVEAENRRRNLLPIR